MIETEDQRRWWFATHPEYSWSHRGIRSRGHEGKPRDLHERRQSQGLLGGQREGSLRSPWFGSYRDGWLRLTSNYPDSNVLMRRLPTTEEISRWPREMVRGFFRALDALLQNNPLLIDPNSLERHHRLINELRDYFMDCGLEIEHYIRILRAADHRLKPDGLHTGEGRGGDWNREWKEFADKYPAKNTREHKERILRQLEEMERRYGVAEKGFLSPKKPKRK